MNYFNIICKSFTVNILLLQNGEYFFIKWKNWSHSFNTWEPRSNLDCDLLITEFHQQCKKNGHSAVSMPNFNDNGNKKSKTDELVKLLYYNGCLTAVSLVDALKQIKASDKV
jgi:Chromo (CHRromatin Organisation MOdifier) domain